MDDIVDIDDMQSLENTTSQSEDKTDERKPIKGICSVCGEPATSKSGTRCSNHRSNRGRKPVSSNSAGEDTTKITPDLEIIQDISDGKLTPQKIQKFINEQVNPTILQFLPSFVGGNTDLYYTVDTRHKTVKLTPVGQAFVPNQIETFVLSQSISQIANSPVSQVMSATLAPILPWVMVLASGVVIFMYGNRVMKTRAQIQEILNPNMYKLNEQVRESKQQYSEQEENNITNTQYISPDQEPMSAMPTMPTTPVDADNFDAGVILNGRNLGEPLTEWKEQ